MTASVHDTALMRSALDKTASLTSFLQEFLQKVSLSRHNDCISLPFSGWIPILFGLRVFFRETEQRFHQASLSEQFCEIFSGSLYRSAVPPLTRAGPQDCISEQFLRAVLACGCIPDFCLKGIFKTSTVRFAVCKYVK